MMLWSRKRADAARATLLAWVSSCRPPLTVIARVAVEREWLARGPYRALGPLKVRLPGFGGVAHEDARIGRLSRW